MIYRKKIMSFSLSFFIIFSISFAFSSMHIARHISQHHILTVVEAATDNNNPSGGTEGNNPDSSQPSGGEAEDDDLSEADQETYRKLKSKSKKSRKKAVKQVNKLRDIVAGIATVIGGFFLGYSIIKYEMSLIDDSPMSKLDAATKMGAAIALICLPAIAVGISDGITAGATTKQVFISLQQMMGGIAIIIGGIVAGSGIFTLIMSIANDNPNEQSSAVRMIAIGILLICTMSMFDALKLTKYIKTGIKITNAGIYI